MKNKSNILSLILSALTMAVGALAFAACGSGGGSGNTSGGSTNSGGTYTRCDSSGTASPTGSYVTFGSYPQTEVTDTALTTSLNSAAGTLPTSGNSQKWTSYNYYIESDNSTDYMWYIDVTYGGSTYRGVYFTSYRPYWTCYESNSDYTVQDDNGYSTGTTYWFKYEPILWRILSESNGTALILSETLIDSQQYYWAWGVSTRSAVDNYDDAYYMGKTETVTESVCANNYKYSDIRAWLNETFYDTAFSSAQKSLIQTTTVDNSALSTIYDGETSYTNDYACEDTNDKVFLLSYEEVTTTAYGFADYDTYDTARQKQSSDYAKSQGCWASTYEGCEGCGWWWLRSPLNGHSSRARGVYSSGLAGSFDYVRHTDGGVLPALQISLS